jgi:hypothetical protein
MAAKPGRVSFEATVTATGNNTGIVLQRYHIDSITSAKSADTRQRRIDKAIALFRAGKQR